jgi:hypothetical protein
VRSRKKKVRQHIGECFFCGEMRKMKYDKEKGYVCSVCETRMSFKAPARHINRITNTKTRLSL